MILSDISIKRPVFTTMVTVALMTLGMLGASKLGRRPVPRHLASRS